MGARSETWERQSIVDRLRALPVRKASELPVIPAAERTAEVLAIKVG